MNRHYKITLLNFLLKQLITYVCHRLPQGAVRWRWLGEGVAGKGQRARWAAQSTPHAKALFVGVATR